MTVHLTLRGARIAYLKGWGMRADPKATARIEFADIGQVTAYRNGLLGDRELLSISIEHLHYSIYTRQHTTGGGFIGGGFGLTGTLAGALQAKVLNALTTRWHEYTLLGLTALHPNGTRQDAAFALDGITESDLRDALLEHIPTWSAIYTDHKLTELQLQPIDEHQIAATHQHIDQMHHARVLTDPQASALRAAASQPLVDTILARLRGTRLSDHEHQHLTARTNQLLNESRITPQQAREIHRQLTATLHGPSATAPPPASARSSSIPSEHATPDHGAGLKALTELRATGAISETEYQAEKHRLQRRP